ncbi:MAG: methyltransferase domain-containing protein [candidate division Zixibacteria bacterium]|nr:methyltransferase domain-containing protein [candidate division Zixibacteria bacterium]
MFNLNNIFDWRKPNSVTHKLRKRRLQLFESIIRDIPGSLRILDIGGDIDFWRILRFNNKRIKELVLLNLYVNDDIDNTQWIKSIRGDATDLRNFEDNEFDIAFSHSTIEHIGTFENQRLMANEMMRVGKNYFVQTPNRYFPIEPHAMVPLGQFLPTRAKVWLGKRFDLGNYRKSDDIEAILKEIHSLRLMTQNELLELFPGGAIWKEKLYMTTKSLVIYGNSENYAQSK